MDNIVPEEILMTNCAVSTGNMPMELIIADNSLVNKIDAVDMQIMTKQASDDNMVKVMNTVLTQVTTQVDENVVNAIDAVFTNSAAVAKQTAIEADKKIDDAINAVVAHANNATYSNNVKVLKPSPITPKIGAQSSQVFMTADMIQNLFAEGKLERTSDGKLQISSKTLEQIGSAASTTSLMKNSSPGVSSNIVKPKGMKCQQQISTPMGKLKVSYSLPGSSTDTTKSGDEESSSINNILSNKRPAPSSPDQLNPLKQQKLKPIKSDLQLSNLDEFDHVGNIVDGIVADETIFLGPGGATEIRFINTGIVDDVNGERTLLYHMITTTGEKTITTNLLIPNPLEPIPPTRKGAKGKKKKKYSNIEDDIKKKYTDLRDRYVRAVTELSRRPKVYNLGEVVSAASKFLSEEQLIFFMMQMKAGCMEEKAQRFSVREKMLAMAIYQRSASVYSWLRGLFHLPSQGMLERWLEGITRRSPEQAKRLMYSIYKRYIFRKNEEPSNEELDDEMTQ